MTETPDPGSESPVEPSSPPSGPQDPPEATEASEGSQDADTFSRSYVEELRRENAEYRTRAKDRDELHMRLLDAVVREGTVGILEDPDDVMRGTEVGDLCDDDSMPDIERVRERARQIAEAKPHLAARRRPTGDVDQGARSEPAEPVNLATMLRERAG